MSTVGQETRRRILEVLESRPGALVLPEVQAELPDLAPKEVANGLMQLVRSGVVHSTGTVRKGAAPTYEPWERVSARMRARAAAQGPRLHRHARGGLHSVNAKRIA